MGEIRNSTQKSKFRQLVGSEKLQHMRNFSKSSTAATILAPLLCIPLYLDNTHPVQFYTWLLAMAVAVVRP